MDFALTLDYDPGVPLYRQLADALKECIISGRLKPGEFLPSTRDLAQMLGLSRVTVVRGYEELISQGFLTAATGRGTCVCKSLPAEALHVAQQLNQHLEPIKDRTPHLSSYAKRVMSFGHARSGSADLPELNYGAPPSEHLPINKWREMLLRYTRGGDHAELAEQDDPMGYRPLREAIAAYLARARGVRCEAEQVAVFGSSQQSVHLVARLLLDAGDRVAVENPGFPQAREQFAVNGSELVMIPVDEKGLSVDDLKRHEDIRLVYVTPSHDPTGAVLPLDRRTELLRWAEKTGAFIIEDDYDNEYRYSGKPIPALQGMDRNDSVIYVATFWKVLYPIVPLGYMVVPRCLIPAVSRAKQLVERTFPMVEQLALTDFIKEGHLERHIKRTRDIYMKRRQSLIYSLTRAFAKRVQIAKDSAGFHLLVRFETQLTDDELIACAIKAQVPMVSTSDYYAEGESAGEFLVGFATVEGEIIAGKVEELARLIKEREQVAV